MSLSKGFYGFLPLGFYGFLQFSQGFLWFLRIFYGRFSMVLWGLHSFFLLNFLGDLAQSAFLKRTSWIIL